MNLNQECQAKLLTAVSLRPKMKLSIFWPSEALTRNDIITIGIPLPSKWGSSAVNYGPNQRRIEPEVENLTAWEPTTRCGSIYSVYSGSKVKSCLEKPPKKFFFEAFVRDSTRRSDYLISISTKSITTTSKN